MRDVCVPGYATAMSAHSYPKKRIFGERVRKAQHLMFFHLSLCFYAKIRGVLLFWKIEPRFLSDYIVTNFSWKSGPALRKLFCFLFFQQYRIHIQILPTSWDGYYSFVYWSIIYVNSCERQIAGRWITVVLSLSIGVDYRVKIRLQVWCSVYVS